MATSGSGLPSAKEPKEDQELHRSLVKQPGREQRRRRERKLTKNGPRPRGQLCWSRRRQRLRSWQS